MLQHIDIFVGQMNINAARCKKNDMVISICFL